MKNEKDQFKHVSLLPLNLMADPLHSLPTDTTPLAPEESRLLNELLHPPKQTFHHFINDLKQPLLFALLFMLFSQSQTTIFFQSFIPYLRESPYSVLLFKAALFGLLVFLIQNVQIVRA
jgi:hypothetical protein